jgi:hypothetical protein
MLSTNMNNPHYVLIVLLMRVDLLSMNQDDGRVTTFITCGISMVTLNVECFFNSHTSGQVASVLRYYLHLGDAC